MRCALGSFQGFSRGLGAALMLGVLSAALPPIECRAQEPANDPAAQPEPPAEQPPADPGVDLNAGRYEELKIPAGLDHRGKKRQDLSDVRRRVGDLKSLINGVLLGEQSLATNQKSFDGYFLQYMFPQMTWVSNIEAPENFNFLTKTRDQFFNQNLRRTTLPEVHDHLIKITLPKMTEIANGNFHPAARCNAMLTIAELNAKEVVRTVPASPAEPLAGALSVMVDALGDPQQIDAVRVAAMLGILRHSQWDARQREKQGQPKRMDDALRDRINQLALAIINEKDPPEGRTLDGHAWMQRRAIDILAVLGTIGTNVNAARTIEMMVADEKAPISLRCTAAESLGLLNLPPETKLEPIDAARKLGDLAVFLGRRELKRLEDEHTFYDEKKKSGGGVGGMPAMGGMPAAGSDDGPASMPGMGGMMGGMPGMMGGGAKAKKHYEDYKLELAQRRIRSQMHSVKVGLGGIKDKTTGILGLVKDNKQKVQIQKLVDEVAGIRDLTDDEDFQDLEKLSAEVSKRLKVVETATKSLALAGRPAPAADAPGADGPDGGPPSKPAPGKAAPPGKAPAPGKAQAANAPAANAAARN